MQDQKHYDMYILDKTECDDSKTLKAIDFAQLFRQKLASKGFQVQESEESSDKEWFSPPVVESKDLSPTKDMEEYSAMSVSLASVIQQISQLKRKSPLIFSGGFSDEMKLLRETGLHDYEVQYGLTKAQDFDSIVDMKAQIKQQWIDENKPLTVLEGKPPSCERLIWLVRDFMMATTDFELNEKISWS